MRACLAVVVSGFPRTSETFAVGELVALARAGMLARVYATKPGDGATHQPGVEELLPLLVVLPDTDVAGQAAAVVADLRAHDLAVDGVHGYFAHRPAEVAAAAADLLGVASSFSVHALDARKVPAAELAARARAAAGVVVCNPDVASHVDVPGAGVRLLPHGVDVARFRPVPQPPGGVHLRVLAVGRLVEKKGLPVLVEAVARLEVPWTLRIVGSGREHARLAAAVAAHGLGDRVELAGRRSHAELPADYAWADVVAVPSVVDSRGDRDGLPNVVLEAMASGRALVVSDVAALGDTVRAAGSGLVVPPGDPAALAAALASLVEPQRRAVLASSGRAHVERHYDLDTCTDRLLAHLEVLHASRPAPRPAPRPARRPAPADV